MAIALRPISSCTVFKSTLDITKRLAKVPEGVPGDALEPGLFEGCSEPCARVLNEPVTLGVKQGEKKG
jgi:hypothetical protein